MYLAEEIQRKWQPILEHADLPKIQDQTRRSVTAVMLENTELAVREASAHGGYSTLNETASSTPVNFMGGSSSAAGTGGIDTFDPVLISLVRRAMPNLIAYDICGVQPMTGPTGLIFAMRSRYANQTGANGYSNNQMQDNETFYNEVNTAFSTGTNALAGNSTFGQGQFGTIPGQTNTDRKSVV
jgi:hypothetical protein